ncbi:unnamed protein product, partial [Allacma fusca]
RVRTPKNATMKALGISVGLVLAMMLAGTALAEGESLYRPFIPKYRGYGYIYNPSCPDRNQVIPGCFRRTCFQRCRYPEHLPPGQDTSLPICPLSKEILLASVPVKSPDDGIKREKRGIFKRFRKRLRKFGKQVENVGKKVRVNYSSQGGWNAGV